MSKRDVINILVDEAIESADTKEDALSNIKTFRTTFDDKVWNIRLLSGWSMELEIELKELLVDYVYEISLEAEHRIDKK